MNEVNCEKNKTLKEIIDENTTTNRNNANISSVSTSKFLSIKHADVDTFCNKLFYNIKRRMKNGDDCYNYGFYHGFIPQHGYTQFRFDIDLKKETTEQETPEQLYTLKQIKQVVQIIHNLFIQNIKDIPPTELETYVLTKEPYTVNGKVKNGFHIEIPHLYITKKNFKNIVQEINDTIIEKKVFTSHIFERDDGFVNNVWLLYGNTKKGYNNPYLVKYRAVYDETDINKKHLKWTDVTESKKNFLRLFWIFPILDTDICYDFNTDVYTKPVWQYLYENNEDDIFNEDDDENDEEDIPKDIEIDDEYDCKIYDFIKYMLNCLNPERCSNTKYWRQIVFSISNFCNKTKKDIDVEKIENLTREWSMKTDKDNYSDDGFNSAWENAGLYKFTIALLIYYYKKDTRLNQLMLKCNDTSFARIIYEMNSNTIVMDDSKTGFVYTKECIWVKAELHDIFAFVEPSLNSCLYDTRKMLKFEREISIVADKKNSHKLNNCILPTLEQVEQKEKMLSKAENYIKTDRNTKGIIQRLSFLCMDKDFEEKLNHTHQNLLPIKNNKVVDLITKDIFERKPEHYMTFVSPIKEGEIKEKERNEAYRFFMDLSNSDERLCNYLVQLFIYFITGYNFDRCFYELIGIGKNGKSLFIAILERILGEAIIPGNSSIIIHDDKHPARSSQPSPEVIKCKGKRMITFTETRPGDKLNCSKIKEYTGGDRVSGRMLYSNNVQKFNLYSKFLVATNHILETNGYDQAVKDRTRIIPFNNRFEVNQDFFNKALTDDFINALFWYAIEHNDFLKKKLIDVPECVILESEEIFEEADPLQNWLCEEIIEKPGKSILSSEMHYRYTEYCKMCDDKPLSIQAFGRRLKLLGYKKERRTKGYEYININFKERDEENQSRLLKQDNNDDGLPPM